MTHVRLVTTTLNESLSMPALAKGCAEMGCDSALILDDEESSDHTDEAAYREFAAVGIPCKVLTYHWTSDDHVLSDKRNALLSLHEAREGLTSSDYIFHPQSDEPPTGSLDKDNLTEQFYLLRVKDYGNEEGMMPMEWDMPILLRSDIKMHWSQSPHEMLVWDEEVTGAKLDSPTINRYGSVATTETRELHVKILLEEFEKSGSPRNAFYLAQTLQCLDRNDEALEWYLKRAEMPGNDEEAFISAYRAGLMTEATNPSNACGYYFDALSLRSFRKEPFFRLAHIANGMKNYEMALMFANQGLKMPDTNDIAFVERWIERWGLEFEWSVAAWNCKIPEAFEAMDRLLARADIHPLTRTWLEHNRAQSF